jgi:hypothetical protein
MAVAAVAAAAAPLAAAAGIDLRHWAIFGAAAAALTLILDSLLPRPGSHHSAPRHQHKPRQHQHGQHQRKRAAP